MKKSIFTVLIALTSFTSVAQNNDAKENFLKRLEESSKSNQTIICQFTQTKKIKNIKNTIDSRGDFFYDNSGLMALIYSDPKGDKVVMKKESFFIVASGKKMKSDAASNPMIAQISNMMRACMSGAVSDLGRGWHTEFSADAKGYQVKLLPTDRRVRKFLNGMTMLFDASSLTLNTLRIDETSGGYTEYQFLEKQINTKFDNSVFNVE